MIKSIDTPLTNEQIKKHIAAEKLKQGKARRSIEDIEEARRIDKEFSLDC